MCRREAGCTPGLLAIWLLAFVWLHILTLTPMLFTMAWAKYTGQCVALKCPMPYTTWEQQECRHYQLTTTWRNDTQVTTRTLVETMPDHMTYVKMLYLDNVYWNWGISFVSGFSVWWGVLEVGSHIEDGLWDIGRRWICECLIQWARFMYRHMIETALLTTIATRVSVHLWAVWYWFPACPMTITHP